MRWLYLMILNPWSSVVKTRHEAFCFCFNSFSSWRRNDVASGRWWRRSLDSLIWQCESLKICLQVTHEKTAMPFFFQIKDSRPFFHVVGPPEVHQCFGSSRYRHLNPQTGPFSVKSNDQLDAWKESPKPLLEKSCEEKYTCARIDKL